MGVGWEWLADPVPGRAGMARGSMQLDETGVKALKSHWVAVSPDAFCGSCKKGFHAARPHGWCGRCGLLFCKRGACLPGSARLVEGHPHPHPDPDGTPCRLCSRCDEVLSRGAAAARCQSRGIHRERTGSFKRARDFYMKKRATDPQYDTPMTPARGSTKFDFASRHDSIPALKAQDTAVNGMSRLTAAFTEYAKEKRLSKLSIVEPSWAKVNVDPKCTSPTCQACFSKFSLFTRRKSCRVCGGNYCSDCVFSSLLVSLDPVKRGRVTVLQRETKIPPTGTILIACGQCLDVVEECTDMSSPSSQQVSSEDSGFNSSNNENEASVAMELTDCYSSLQRMLKSVESALARFDVVTASADDPGPRFVQQVAKHQGDASTGLAAFEAQLRRLKRLPYDDYDSHYNRRGGWIGHDMKAVLQSMLVRWTRVYRDCLHQFRDIKKQWSNKVPDDLLEQIATLVDRECLTAAFCLTQQMAIETLAFNLTPLTKQLMGITNSISSDLKKACETSGEDWDDYQKRLANFVRYNGKNAPLLRRSGEKKTGTGPRRLRYRVTRTLRLVEGHLKMRATDSTASAIVDNIEKTIDELPGFLLKSEIGDSWEVL